MSFLAHKNWSGLSALGTFIGIPIAFIALVVAIDQERATTKTKSIEIHETGRYYLGGIQGENHSYMIDFSVINTGNDPILEGDWIDKPAIMTPPFQTISTVTSSSPYGITTDGVSTQ